MPRGVCVQDNDLEEKPTLVGKKTGVSSRIFTHMYPARTFMSELFPAPEGPMMAVSWPERNSPLTPWMMYLDSADNTN